MCRFPEALRLVEKLADEAASEDSNITMSAFRVTFPDNAVLPSADELKALLCSKAALTQTRVQKQNSNFNGRVFYLYAASVFQKLINMHTAASDKHPKTYD